MPILKPSATGGTATADLTIAVSGQPPPQAAGVVPWRFLWGPAQPAGGITGEIIQAQQRTITLRTEPDQNSEASFDIDGSDPAAAGIAELQADLTVMYGPQVVFQGRIGPTQDSLDPSGHRVTMTAYDYRSVLRRRALFAVKSYASQDQAAIAWDLISYTQGRPGGDLGIARGVGQSTGIIRTAWNFAAGDFIGDSITQLAQATNGFEWQITPYGLSDLRLDLFSPFQAADRGRVLEWGSERVAAISRTVDASTYANALYVTGDSSIGGLTASVAASDIASRPEGRWDQVVGTQLASSSSLGDYAQGALQRAEVVLPSYTVTLTPGSWQGPGDLWLGELVTLWITSGRLNLAAKVRVVEMTFDIDASNNETLSLTLGAIPFDLAKQVPKMLRRLRLLEKR